MDELAVKLGMAPIELGMKNYAEVYPGRNVPYSSKTLAESYLLGAENFGWSRRNAKAVSTSPWLILATSFGP
jgi:xanthine dehydrogenase YagR molybdenum-binding subunit